MRGHVFRQMISAVVVMGLIAHAFAIVRHGAMVISKSPASFATLAPPSAIAALEADLKTAICHPGSSQSGSDDNAPVSPRNECPICAGLVFAFIMPPPQVATLALPELHGIVAFPASDQRVTRQRFLRPASRGPPAIA